MSAQKGEAAIRKAYFEFRNTGKVRPGLVPPAVERSWRRCCDPGLRISLGVPPGGVSPASRDPEAASSLLRIAAPVMDAMFEQLADSRSAVLLADSAGRLMQVLATAGFAGAASRLGLAPGCDWSEAGRGTNAIALAITESAPTVVAGAQHFCTAYHKLTMAAAPCSDARGRLAGVVAVGSAEGPRSSGAGHGLALVRLAARMIEQRMFLADMAEHTVLRLNRRGDRLGSTADGMIALADDGGVLAMDSALTRHFGASTAIASALHFRDLFATEWPMHVDPGSPVVLVTADGIAMKGEFVNGDPGTRGPLVRGESRREFTAAVVPQRLGEDALSRLDTGDARMHAVISKIRKLGNRDIPVLILGETGTGKELLARAIHDSGPRRDGAFVALNCAAIPEGLIEAELFGYEPGAFTGASRRGSRGRIVEADRGTLFLDEIGDMPRNLQARLLRVLQERVVSPVGGGAEVLVDVRLVCATHRRLKECVADGAFREDLYYRLNGLVLNLPPLRERQDLHVLVRRILAGVGGSGAPVEVEPTVLDAFLRHRWPGNLRQLSNVIRAATAIAGEDRVIVLDHLPEDFVAELEAVPLPQWPIAGTPLPQHPKPTGELDLATSRLILEVLERNYGNVAAAARQLGISRTTLYRRLKLAGRA